MSLTFRNLSLELSKRIRSQTINDMVEFCKNEELPLWGQKRPANYIKLSIVVALYKDAFKIGFDALFDKIDRWYPNSKNSFVHNQKVIREFLRRWAETVIKLGSLDDWKLARENVEFDKEVNDTLLWIDSVDFGLTGKRHVSRKSREWSYKINGPGIRFIVISDAIGLVRKVYGGYSPKTYDGDFLKIVRRSFEKKFENAVFVGDNHFLWGVKNFKKIKFHCNVKLPANRISKSTGKGITTLTKKQRAYNAAIKRTRARVEGVFGQMGKKFEALTKPFGEGEDQLEHLVFIAIGVLNYEQNL
jgi:hypothetical protein